MREIVSTKAQFEEDHEGITYRAIISEAGDSWCMGFVPAIVPVDVVLKFMEAARKYLQVPK